MKFNISKSFYQILLAGVFSFVFFNIDLKNANAEFSNLTPCKESYTIHDIRTRKIFLRRIMNTCLMPGLSKTR